MACYFDLEERRIPNEITYGMFLTGMIYHLLKDGFAAITSVLGWTLLCLGLLAIASRAFSFGGGDVKLALASAAWLQEYTPIAVFVALLLVLTWTFALTIKKHGFKSFVNSAILEVFYGLKINQEIRLAGALFLTIGYIVADCIYTEAIMIIA